jgi:hypothetical protein
VQIACIYARMFTCPATRLRQLNNPNHTYQSTMRGSWTPCPDQSRERGKKRGVSFVSCLGITSTSADPLSNHLELLFPARITRCGTAVDVGDGCVDCWHFSSWCSLLLWSARKGLSCIEEDKQRLTVSTTAKMKGNNAELAFRWDLASHINYKTVARQYLGPKLLQSVSG